MKKLLLFLLTFYAVASAHAQDLPYSKYLNFSKSDFKENHFKYHEKTNTWYLNKTNGLSETFNILLIITGSFEDTRPDINDYSIVVQFGEEEKASCVRVIYYNDETYIRLLTYLKNNCQNLMDVSTGKLTRHLATYGEYELELTMEKHTISRTSARTADPLTVKNVDESYNEYEFVIRTDVEPWSRYLEKQAAKQAKRDAKGKKKQSVDSLW